MYNGFFDRHIFYSCHAAKVRNLLCRSEVSLYWPNFLYLFILLFGCDMILLVWRFGQVDDKSQKKAGEGTLAFHTPVPRYYHPQLHLAPYMCQICCGILNAT
jgi:hypothetical protein